MADPNDPIFQTTGEPFFTTVKGVSAPDIAGDAVPLVSGDPVTVSAEVNGVQSGQRAIIRLFGGGDTVVVTGLEGLTPSSVGRQITLIGCAEPGNNGTFTISAVSGSALCAFNNPNGVFPDANSGAIAWKVAAADDTDFPPGDPLTYLADQIDPNPIPLVLAQETGAPEGGGQEILGPGLTVTDPVQDPHDEGEMDPDVAGIATGVGPVSLDDPQNPVREAPNALFVVNDDPNSLAFGLSPILADGPAVQTPGLVVTEPNPAVASEDVGTGEVQYGPIEQSIAPRTLVIETDPVLASERTGTGVVTYGNVNAVQFSR